MNTIFHHPLPFRFHPKKKIDTIASPVNYSVKQVREELKKRLGSNFIMGLILFALVNVVMIGSYYAL
ncbi:MAG: hypothetical protein WCI84_09825 [Bacteroidota bacterium]